MDIVLLIDKFLSDKQHLVTDNCSFNVVGDSIHRWDFANIPCPSMEELLALQPEVESKLEQEKQNAEALKFLADTDYKVLRHIRQQALGISTTLTAQEYLELEQERQMAAEAVIK